MPSMSEPQLGYFFPVGGGYPGLPKPPGGIVRPPIVLPPLPGIWPKPGEPSLPIQPPDLGGDGEHISPPIFIPEEPGHPLPKPPGTIWPPLPPDLGLEGKVAILIWIVGVGFRWYIYDAPSIGGGPVLPGVPTPK